jgi:peptidoglycan/LPS O-acetylase OafA/YrhL
MTLDEALKANKGIGPGFHMLRHALAAIIFFHHCRVSVFGVHANDYAGKGAAFGSGGQSHLSTLQIGMELLRPGLFALVGIFFALSGFLVAGSAIRTTIKGFFLNRALRIIPALSVEITLSALLLGAFVTTLPLSEYYSNPEFFRYFGNIFGFVTFTLPGVFQNNPNPNIVNANLWTLPPEFWCYFVMLGIMATGLIRRSGWLSMAIVGVLLVGTILSVISPEHFPIRTDTTHYNAAYLTMAFAVGTLFFVHANKLPMNGWIAAGCAAAYYFLTLFNIMGFFSVVFLTYCTAYVGILKFPRFDRWQKSDISYGIYLYGFPITQTVIFFVLPHIGDLPGAFRYLIILSISLILTVVFASLSWQHIEKPALALRKTAFFQRWAPARAPSSDAARISG